MSVVHELLSQVEKQDKSPGVNRLERRGEPEKGILDSVLPEKVLNDFYDLREYIRIANKRDQMQVVTLASSLPGEGSPMISSYLSYLMANGSVTKSTDADEMIQEEVDPIFKPAFKSKTLNSGEERKRSTEVVVKRDILLVDANLRDPGLHCYFDLEAEEGLGEILEGHMDWKKVIKPVHGADLKVITAGVAEKNPAELLGSLEFGDLVGQWRETFRTIVFDSPPVLPYVDSLCLSAVSDGMILVLRAAQTRWEEAQNAKRKLVAAHANLIGVTLNSFANGFSVKV